MTKLYEKLHFRSKKPKLIDLTEENDRLPEQLKEMAVYCAKE